MYFASCGFELCLNLEPSFVCTVVCGWGVGGWVVGGATGGVGAVLQVSTTNSPTSPFCRGRQMPVSKFRAAVARRPARNHAIVPFSVYGLCQIIGRAREGAPGAEAHKAPSVHVVTRLFLINMLAVREQLNLPLVVIYCQWELAWRGSASRPCLGLLWDGGNSRPTRIYFASCGFELCLNLEPSSLRLAASLSLHWHTSNHSSAALAVVMAESIKWHYTVSRLNGSQLFRTQSLFFK
jgi:hypothetical protein